MSSEEFNTKIQRHQHTKSEDDISHQIQVLYKGVAIREPLFIDILVEDKVLVEVKATEKKPPYL